MDRQTSGQKQVGKYGKKAVGTLDAAETDMLANQAFRLGQDLVMDWGKNVETYTPEVIANMKANAIGGATNAFQANAKQFAEVSGAQGTARSGAARSGERRLAAEFGNTIGDINRTVDTQAAMQRNPDRAAFLDAASHYLAQRYQFARDKANAYLGVAAHPVWGQPSPLSQAMGGFGQLAGALAPRFLFPSQFAPGAYGR